MEVTAKKFREIKCDHCLGRGKTDKCDDCIGRGTIQTNVDCGYVANVPAFAPCIDTYLKLQKM